MKTLKAITLAVILAGSATAADVMQYRPEPVTPPQSSGSGGGNNTALTIGVSVVVSGLVYWMFRRHKSKAAARREAIRYHVQLLG